MQKIGSTYFQKKKTEMFREGEVTYLMVVNIGKNKNDVEWMVASEKRKFTPVEKKMWSGLEEKIIKK